MNIIMNILFSFFYALFITILFIILFIGVCYGIYFYIQKLKQKEEIKNNIDGNGLAFLLIRIPQINEKKEEAFDTFLKSIHRVLPKDAVISLELTSFNKFLNFYIVISKKYTELIESQLYAQYPDVEIEVTTDYLSTQEQDNTAFVDIRLKKLSIHPIKTYSMMEDNLLRNIMAFLARLESDEQFFLHLTLKRIGSKFWKRGLIGIYYELFGKKVASDGNSTLEYTKLSSKYIYNGVLRLGFKAESGKIAKDKLDLIFNFLKQLKYSNEFKMGSKYILGIHNPNALKVRARIINRKQLWIPEEIATIYHLPYKTSDISNIVQTRSRKAPPPDILPRYVSENDKNISLIGETNYRNEKIKFGIKRDDRRRHVYIVGKTGAGKSKLIELMMLEDIKDDCGFCLIDPHGDLAKEVISHIPKNRIKDVVYVNPTDRDFPIPFNPLEYTGDYERRQQVAVFFNSIFKKIFKADWNERMEHILRFIILALLETQDSNVLGITRILTDTKYRTRVIGEIRDPVVKAFWSNEYASWNEQFSNQAIVPIMNKVGQFLANPIIRNMVGQPKNALDFEKFMNEGKIVIINLSKGQLGDDNMALLGSMFITKIQQTALARAKIAEEKRKDFYFYIDEFQNFATDAFNSILSEARKYRLNLTVAHQYINQLPQDIKASVFGNVATMIAFAVGSEDAGFLSKEFSPVFKADDLINLEARELYIKMSVDGKVTKPFSARTINVNPSQFSFGPEIIDYSREKYGENRVVIERDIERWVSTDVSSGNLSTNEEFPEPII